MLQSNKQSEFVTLYSNPEDTFQKLDILGEGAYGSVYKALHKESGQYFAVKIVPTTGEIKSLKQEIQILRDCKSDYIVKYFGSYYSNGQLWLIMEYCQGGSVIDLIKACGVQKEEFIATVLQNTLLGLEYLHHNKKIHRDVKSGNILMDSNGNVKLADFGVSTQLMHTLADKDTQIGSPYWMSPEILQKSKHNKKTDIWSLGITALEMAEGEPPYSHLHPVRAMFAIQKNPPSGFQSPEQWSPDFNSFIHKCLTVDPKERPTAKELLHHPFIIKNLRSREFICQVLKNNSKLIEKYRCQKIQQHEGKENINPSNQQTEEDNSGTTKINDPTGTVLVKDQLFAVNDTGTMLERQFAQDGEYEEAVQRICEYGFDNFHQKDHKEQKEDKKQECPQQKSPFSKQNEKPQPSSFHQSNFENQKVQVKFPKIQYYNKIKKQIDCLEKEMESELSRVRIKYLTQITQLQNSLKEMNSTVMVKKQEENQPVSRMESFRLPTQSFRQNDFQQQQIDPQLMLDKKPKTQIGAQNPSLINGLFTNPHQQNSKNLQKVISNIQQNMYSCQESRNRANRNEVLEYQPIPKQRQQSPNLKYKYPFKIDKSGRNQ